MIHQRKTETIMCYCCCYSYRMVLEPSQTLWKFKRFFLSFASFFIFLFQRMNTAHSTQHTHTIQPQHIVPFLYAYTFDIHWYTNTHAMRHRKSLGFSAILFDSAISVSNQILCGAFVFSLQLVCPFYYFEKIGIS